MTVKEISTYADLETAFETSKIVVLVVHASWCSYFEQLADQYSSENVQFYKYNCAIEKEIAQYLEINTIQSFIVFEKGEFTECVTGINKENIKAMIERTLFIQN
jgi:hypothetical protein